MPERPGPAAPQEVQPDLEREAGLRGADFTRAAWALGFVFLAGIVVVALVLAGRRRRRS